jgi:TonB-dependent SusC/RagA subfamily outer membrane receptor
MYKVFTKIFCNPPDYVRKFILIMKVTTILIFAILMQVSAAGLAQRITLNQKKVSLKQIFNEINKQTGYSILWSAKKIKNDRLQDVRLNNVTVDEALSTCLKGFPLSYAIDNKTIVIRENQSATNSGATGLPRAKAIQGKVTDINGNPLPGASIKVKGTNKQAVADTNGAFTIDASPGDILIVSFVSFAQTEVTLGNQTSVTIALKEASNELNNVVVTALGIRKQARSLSYNVQEISGAEVTKVKDANFINTLAGKVAGVTINSSSSGVGGSARVVMRGTKSIAGNNNAMFVVDGIPMPSLSTAQPTDLFSGAGQSGDGISNINPEDIESISILSGPSAAALYGKDAANGVVMITTKKGSKDGFQQLHLSGTLCHAQISEHLWI